MISVVCPAYEMQGRGVEMLHELLASIYMQTFNDCEVVVSGYDHNDRGWLNLDYECRDWAAQGMRVVCRFGLPGAAANLNFAIDSAHGDIIKPMFQDDKFIDPDSLQKIADAFDKGAQWVACTSHNVGLDNYDHVPYPHKSLERLREGENTYGSPSAMAWIKNDLRFDEHLSWLFDCEFYARMAGRYGVPGFVDTPIYIRQWDGMATKTIATGHQRVMDSNYVIEKYR